MFQFEKRCYNSRHILQFLFDNCLQSQFTRHIKIYFGPQVALHDLSPLLVWRFDYKWFVSISKNQIHLQKIKIGHPQGCIVIKNALRALKNNSQGRVSKMGTREALLESKAF